MLTALRLGMDFALACPAGYQPNPDMVAQAEGLAAVSGASLSITHDPARSASTARTRSTRTSGPAWARNSEAILRKKAFHAYQVNEALFGDGAARRDLHALPAGQARRGDHRRRHGTPSARAVFDQAENRLHAQKALCYLMML